MARRLTDDDRMLRAISETAWQHAVEGIAAAGRWRYYHAPDNRPITAAGSGRRYVQAVRRGFPDLVAVRRGRMVVVELKTETGTVTDDQHAWLTDLAAAGVEVGVWRPRDRDLVEAVLLHGAPMPTWPPR